MIEILARVLDGPGRAGGGAGAARAAVPVERRRRLERHVREDRDQPEARSVFRIDQEVVAAEPAQAGGQSDVLVGDMGPLALPVDDLRGGDGQGAEALFLKGVGHEERAPVEEGVRLPVVVEIERGRAVADVVEDGAGEGLPERDGPSETRPRFRLEKETVAERRDVGDAEEVEAEVEGESP